MVRGAHWQRMTKAESVIVNKKTGGAVRGLIVRTMGPLIELAECELLEDDSPRPIPVDGRVIIDTDNIDYVQLLGG